MTRLLLGTRGSALARAQSEWVASALRAALPDLSVELRVITTTGDRVLDVALSAVGDKGLFVKELEQALLAGEVDLCVHSAKDMPTETPTGLTLAEAEDFIKNYFARFSGLKKYLDETKRMAMERGYVETLLAQRD